MPSASNFLTLDKKLHKVKGNAKLKLAFIFISETISTNHHSHLR